VTTVTLNYIDNWRNVVICRDIGGIGWRRLEKAGINWKLARIVGGLGWR